ncbi:MAG: long-chain fatty acid--CoA ligase [Desulfobacteraceae bacterium]|nr:AMP-binding protein [Desulfobacteraceae bacterium]MBC2755421.1 long-chain fatty acid--CoA ligase [Desulfobacteraceae bacterium]
MKNQMPPRYQAGADFFDKALIDCYQNIGYPEAWLEEGRTYAAEDAYVISHPSWFMEPLPPIPMISVYQLFKETVKKYPDDTAVIFLDKKISYQNLDDLICRYAAMLKGLGIGKGDVVATMLPNSLQHIVAFYAVTMIGAIHTPIDVMYQTDEIAYQVKDSGAENIFILDILYDKVEGLKENGQIDNIIVTNVKDWAEPNVIIPNSLKYFWETPKQPIDGTIDFFESVEKCTPLEDAEPVDSKKDPALLLYAMGTTGKPLGVIETHFNLVFNSLTHAHAFRSWEGREVNFSIMPMFHTSGYLLHQLPALYQGGTVIPIPLFNLEDSFRIIKTYGVNVIFAPPTFFIALMSRPDLIDLYDLSSIKASIGCAAPVPVEVQKQWKELTGIPLINGWGMTETNSGGIISIPGIKEKEDAIGIPVYSEVKITDAPGNIVTRNVEGEICYRGLQVAAGYLNKAKETEAAFLPDGWLRTGDRGYIDEQDFIHFVDRIKDLIVASGYNIAPREIENVLYLHPAVEEVAVVSHPDPYRGETVKAVISLKIDYMGKVSEADIIDFCKQHLASYKVPRIIDFRDILPKSPIGKIMRHELK